MSELFSVAKHWMDQNWNSTKAHLQAILQPQRIYSILNAVNVRDFKGSIQNVNVFLLYYEVRCSLLQNIHFTRRLIFNFSYSGRDIINNNKSIKQIEISRLIRMNDDILDVVWCRVCVCVYIYDYTHHNLVLLAIFLFAFCQCSTRLLGYSKTTMNNEEIFWGWLYVLWIWAVSCRS